MRVSLSNIHDTSTISKKSHLLLLSTLLAASACQSLRPKFKRVITWLAVLLIQIQSWTNNLVNLGPPPTCNRPLIKRQHHTPIPVPVHMKWDDVWPEIYTSKTVRNQDTRRTGSSSQAYRLKGKGKKEKKFHFKPKVNIGEYSLIFSPMASPNVHSKKKQDRFGKLRILADHFQILPVGC